MNEQFSSVHLATILVIDDMILNLAILTKGLKKDFNVVCLESGEAALEYLENNQPPSLIILDIMMPGMNGYDVCKSIKSNPRLLDIPIIFITAMNSKEDEELALSIGAADFITKPFDLPITIARIYTHINLQRKISLLDNLSLLDKSLKIPNKQYFEYYLQRSWRKINTNKYFLGLSITTTTVNIEDESFASTKCLYKIAEILWKSCVFPGSVVSRIGDNIFATIIPGEQFETIVSVVEGMQKHLEAQAQKELKISCSDLKISTGLAIARPCDEKFPTTLRSTAEKVHNLAVSSPESRFIFELSN